MRRTLTTAALAILLSTFAYDESRAHGGAVAATPSAHAPQPRQALRPTLVVVITVDQLRADYFTRFAEQLTGGLRRLADHGAFYTNAFHDHAITETAPGHASVLSGRHPRGTGILRNSTGVQDPQAPLIGAAGPGASPFRFRGTTLIDWLRFADPRSRALSVSRKDRGAILPLGRAKQAAVWYSDDRFTTSRYYGDTLPTWVAQFNARELPRRTAGRPWTLLLPASAYPEADDVAQESGGMNVTFPHAAPGDSALAARFLPEFPWMDDLTLALALEGMHAMELGRGPHPDVLAISLSATDAIGHRYGPDSREVHDQILRLDRILGAFFDTLFTRIDSSQVLVALTADHGVAPYPGVVSRDPNRGARSVDLGPVVLPFLAALRARGVDSGAVYFEQPTLFAKRDALERAGVNADSAFRAFAAAVRRVPGVERADLLRSLGARDTVRDVIARRWLHMYPPDAGAEVVVTLAPYNVPGPAYAHHGSPHHYDAHVPLIFYGAPFRAGKQREMARVVDLAPTLARALGVVPSERLEGRVLRSAFR